MEFDWHEAKSEKNVRDRGFGFDFASLIFQGRVLSQTDDRLIMDEVRVKANRKGA
jgi:uncharacterized DUF497 family protein